MVMRLLCALLINGLLLIPVTAVATQSTLRLVNAGPAEYGKPVDIDLYAGPGQGAITTLELSATDLEILDRDFVVDSLDHQPAAADGQFYRLRLYARRPGKLRIPALHFQGHTSKPLTLEVSPAMDRRGNEPIRVATHFNKESDLWVSEALPVSLHIESGTPYAHLDTTATEGTGLKTILLPYRRSKPTGSAVTRHSIGWVLYPQSAGEHSIQLPPVLYQRDGVVTHRFYPPRLKLKVRPLPAFVPPTMPVGEMQLQVLLPEQWFVYQQELTFLQLRIRSSAHPDASPAVLLRQLQGSRSLSLYSAQPEAREHLPAYNGFSELRYRVPVAATTTGIIELPALRLQYFDPVSGKIVTRIHRSGRLVVLSPWLVYGGMLIALLLLCILLSAFFRRARRRYRRYRAYRQIVVSLRQARTPEDLRAAVAAMAAAESWSENITLLEWLQRWGARYPRLSSVKEPVLQLQKALYGRGEIAPDEIRAALITICLRV